LVTGGLVGELSGVVRLVGGDTHADVAHPARWYNYFLGGKYKWRDAGDHPREPWPILVAALATTRATTGCRRVLELR
jgi:hypothetical protein